MKPNSTSINKYLSLDKQVYKHNINSICKRLNVSIKDLDRDVDSKLLADTWILMLKEQLLAHKEQIAIEKRLSILYRYCIPYKVDCFNALCRFMEFKFGRFIDTPDRHDYWFNPIVDKLGYFENSCGDICKEMQIKDHRVYILDNLKQEFFDYIDKYNMYLAKYRKSQWIDYSHLAYNNVADDL